MANIIITSLSSGAGKTAICAGIGGQLVSQGKKVGYLRPAIGTTATGGDASFMKEVLPLQQPVEAIGPGFSDENQFKANFKKSFDNIASGKDVVLIEYSGGVAVKDIPVKTVMVVTYAEINDDKVATVYKSLGQQVIGCVINKVPASQLDRIKKEVVPALSKSGVTILGVIPEDRKLMTFDLTDLAKVIDGQVLNNPERMDTLAGNFMLGAMTVDSGLPYFERITEKVVVVRGERPDMQMAALRTPTYAMVVTGGTPMIPQVMNLAEDKKVPVITTTYDCATVADRIEENIVKMRFHQKSKIARIQELMTQGVNLLLLYKSAGVL